MDPQALGLGDWIDGDVFNQHVEHSGGKEPVVGVRWGECELTFGLVELMCLWDVQGASPTLALP